VMVSDFGSAKARGVTGANSSAGGVKGKLACMAPEQANVERDVDGRLDLYAVGVALWELLTGQQLHNGDTSANLAAILIDDSPLPSLVRKDIPRDLEAVVMQLLARKRENRSQTAREARVELFACDAALKDGRGELVAVLAKRSRAAVAREGTNHGW